MTRRSRETFGWIVRLITRVCREAGDPDLIDGLSAEFREHGIREAIP